MKIRLGQISREAPLSTAKRCSYCFTEAAAIFVDLREDRKQGVGVVCSSYPQGCGFKTYSWHNNYVTVGSLSKVLKLNFFWGDSG